MSPNAATSAELAASRWQLSDDQWARLAPLLPPQKGATGRPAHDHRKIISAILWVQRLGKSWRELPDGFGPWQTPYGRYLRWRKSGLWQQISQALHQMDDQTPEPNC